MYSCEKTHSTVISCARKVFGGYDIDFCLRCVDAPTTVKTVPIMCDILETVQDRMEVIIVL